MGEAIPKRTSYPTRINEATLNKPLENQHTDNKVMSSCVSFFGTLFCMPIVLAENVCL